LQEEARETTTETATGAAIINILYYTTRFILSIEYRDGF
jgi:hypothetical protein